MDSPEKLTRRIAAATESDQVLGMFFESVFRRVATVSGAAAAEDVRARLIGKKKLIGFFKYPVADLLRTMQLGAERSGGDFIPAIEAFGGAAVDDFLGSPVGKTLSALAGTNIHRLISSAPASYRACATFADCTYERLDERGARLTYRKEFMGPAAQAGVVKAVLRAMCQVEPEVRLLSSDDAGMAFALELRW